MKRLLHVSKSCIDEEDPSSRVSKIVADFQLKNTALGITGAILFTGRFFVHIIEGPQSSVEELMGSLGNDPRHGNVHIVDCTQITRRRFQELKLAYSGSSKFVARRVMGSFHLVTAEERKSSSDWWTELAYEFLKPPTTVSYNG